VSDRLRVVAGAVVRGGRVLVARRAPDMPLPGCWELPGGKVERGEDDRAALVRELREELDIEVTVADCLGVSDWDGGRRPLRLVAYRCTLHGTEPHAHEHDALAWVGPDALDDLRWAPADLPFVAPLRALLAIG
jgi:8-oxo-dGTP diphosphatase